MGWCCGGTEIFDTVCKQVLDNKDVTEKTQKRIIKKLYAVLQDHDWDCESDSLYVSHPIVKEIFLADGNFDEEWYEEMGWK